MNLMRVSAEGKEEDQKREEEIPGAREEGESDALYFVSEKLTCKTGSCPEILNRVMLGALRMAFWTRKDMLIRSRMWSSSLMSSESRAAMQDSRSFPMSS